MLTDRKITTYEDNIKALSDTPSSDGINAETLKAFFDGRTDKEIKASINGIVDDLEAMEIEKAVISDDIRHARLNVDKVIETSTDGTTWEATGSSGHIVLDKNGNILAQRSRLKFIGDTTVTDNGTETVVSGLQGLQGVQGVQGIQGIQGEKGDKGDTGNSIIPNVDQNTGLMSFTEGPAGVVPASVNVRGPQGPQGVQGLQGAIGPKGDQGNQGLKGDIGDTGPRGPQGEIGPKGDQGIQGPQGYTGSQGPKGDKGDIGAAGPQGSQGIKGDAGSQGPQGIQGLQGQIGPDGPRGLTGAQGPTGPQGLKGDNGIDGTSFMLKGLYATLYALQVAHPIGNVGDAYAVGTSTNNVIYNWDVDTAGWVSLGQLQGPQGPQGIQGIQGEQGIQGPKGDKGDNGDQGVQGEQGLQGVPGPNAVTTSTATGINGIIKGNGSVVSQAAKADITTLSKPSGVRFIIGTSTAGWTAADCDYLCDGTADQTEINAAITALPATGGEIVILDGTYNITAKIDVTKDNVSIRGNGDATILKRMFNSSVSEGVITLTSRSGCKIANLQIDGNKTSYTNNNNDGIYLYSSSNNTVTGNTCNNNNYGIYLSPSSSNTVTGNTCNNNNYGIRLSSSSSSNTVTGNTCNNNNYGIYLSSSSSNTVTGNTCIRGTGLATDYTESQHTIWLKGTGNNYNLISNNNCMGKAVTNEGGTGNTLVNNKFDAA